MLQAALVDPQAAAVLAVQLTAVLAVQLSAALPVLAAMLTAQLQEQQATSK
jgi:hypothetical protein